MSGMYSQHLNVNFVVNMFPLCQDILSLWDLHFLVMIHCWPDLTVHDFELTTECGSASMVAYVSVRPERRVLFYTKLKIFNSFLFFDYYRQDKGSMRMITLTKQENSQVTAHSV